MGDAEREAVAPYRVLLPVGPEVEDAEADAAALVRRAASVQALLAPTASQGSEGDAARLVFGMWSLELGIARRDAGRADDAVTHLEQAATIVEIVVGHQPYQAEALRVAGQAVAALAEVLLLTDRPGEAWDWAARSIAVPVRLAELQPEDPEGPLLGSRLSATLASLSLARRGTPPQLSIGGQPVEAFHGLLVAAVDHAAEAVRRGPTHLPARHQLVQEAWNLAVHLSTRPGRPGFDADHYAALALDAAEPLTAVEPYATACAPAVKWCRTRLRPGA